MDAVLDLRADEQGCESPAHAGDTGRSGKLPAEKATRTSLVLLREQYHYNHWIYSNLRPFVRGRICDVGCGIGNITQFLLNYDQVVGIEPSADSFRQAQAYFSNHLNVRLINAFLSDVPQEVAPAGSFDTVLCVNVLCEIEDEIAALRAMRQLCRPGGNVVVLAAAHMGLYGALDRAYGFYRRHSRRSLRRAFESAGLRPTTAFHMNALGFFGWWWHSRVLKRKQIGTGSTRFFERLVPFLDAFERVVRPPFGQSLVMVGTPTA